MRILSAIAAIVVIAGPLAGQTARLDASDGQGALGAIPCAAFEGQAMKTCPAELRHKEDGSATLAVVLPGGDTRRIYFENGQATSSSSPSAMRVETREAITIIFIDPGEVYEIPNAALARQ